MLRRTSLTTSAFVQRWHSGRPKKNGQQLSLLLSRQMWSDPSTNLLNLVQGLVGSQAILSSSITIYQQHVDGQLAIALLSITVLWFKTSFWSYKFGGHIFRVLQCAWRYMQSQTTFAVSIVKCINTFPLNLISFSLPNQLIVHSLKVDSTLLSLQKINDSALFL